MGRNGTTSAVFVISINTHIILDLAFSTPSYVPSAICWHY